MHDPAKVIPIRDVGLEERRANTLRLVHEFAVYCVWHLSLTKPDRLAMRILLNDMLREWLGNEFSCGSPNCLFCQKDENIANRTGFRSMYRNLIGHKEMGNRHG